MSKKRLLVINPGGVVNSLCVKLVKLVKESNLGRAKITLLDQSTVDIVIKHTETSASRVPSKKIKTLKDFRAAWDKLTKGQQAWVKGKAKREGMTLLGVVNGYGVPRTEHLNQDGSAK